MNPTCSPDTATSCYLNEIILRLASPCDAKYGAKFCNLIVKNTPLHNCRIGTHDHLIGRNILDDRRTGADDGPVADGHAGADERISGDPDFLTNDYGRFKQRESTRGVIVSARRKGANIG